MCNKTAFVANDILRIVSKASGYDLLLKKLKEALAQSWSAQIQLAAYEIIENLDTPGKVSEADLTKALKAISRVLGEDFATLTEPTLFDATEEFWKYEVKSLNMSDKEQIGINLDLPDKRAVKALAKGNTAWIKGHSLKSKLAKEITDELITVREMGLTRKQARVLFERKFGQYAPADIAKYFGEDQYWDGFIRAHATRTRTFADITTYGKAGYTNYSIFSRLSERTCPICRRMHGVVYKVADAAKQMEGYYTAADKGDINGMKKAFPWLTDTPDYSKAPQKGLLPSFHFRCECRIKVYRTSPKAITDNLGKVEINAAKNGSVYRYLDRGALGTANTTKKGKIEFTTLDNTGKEYIKLANLTKADPEVVRAISNPLARAVQEDSDITIIGKNGYVVEMRDNVINSFLKVKNTDTALTKLTENGYVIYK